MLCYSTSPTIFISRSACVRRWLSMCNTTSKCVQSQYQIALFFADFNHDWPTDWNRFNWLTRIFSALRVFLDNFSFPKKWVKQFSNQSERISLFAPVLAEVLTHVSKSWRSASEPTRFVMLNVVFYANLLIYSMMWWPYKCARARSHSIVRTISLASFAIIFISSILFVWMREKMMFMTRS